MGIKIRGEKREKFGKNACRRLRVEGKMPAILYGAETSNVPLIVKKNDIISILKSESGENTIFQVSYDSETREVMIKDVQTNPVTDEILHVDLIQILLDKAIRVSVSVVPTGEAVGVKTEGGFIDFITRELEVECLPRDIPEHIEVDISSLHIHQSLKTGDIMPPEGVKIVSDKDSVVLHIDVPPEEKVVEGEKEEEVIAEGEEPEVIKKEREEGEEEKKGRGEEKEVIKKEREEGKGEKKRRGKEKE